MSNDLAHVSPKQAKAMLDKYVNKSIMDEFEKVPTRTALALTQTVPPAWIAQREIGGKTIDYLPGWSAQKILNFIFCFNISTKIISHSVKQYKQLTSYYDKTKKAWAKKESQVFEATVHMEFIFTSKEGSKISREFISTHKAFENSATANDDCLKGAISKAWTLAAHSFGIGSNVKGQLHPEAPMPVDEETGEVEAVTPVASDFSSLPY